MPKNNRKETTRFLNLKNFQDSLNTLKTLETMENIRAILPKHRNIEG